MRDIRIRASDAAFPQGGPGTPPSRFIARSTGGTSGRPMLGAVAAALIVGAADAGFTSFVVTKTQTSRPAISSARARADSASGLSGALERICSATSSAPAASPDAKRRSACVIGGALRTEPRLRRRHGIACGRSGDCRRSGAIALRYSPGDEITRFLASSNHPIG